MASWQITDNKFDFSISHCIEAVPETVYRVLAEMEAYPEFINDLISVRREGNLYHFVARAALFLASSDSSLAEAKSLKPSGFTVRLEPFASLMVRVAPKTSCPSRSDDKGHSFNLGMSSFLRRSGLVARTSRLPRSPMSTQSLPWCSGLP